MAFASTEKIKRDFSRCVIPFDPARVENAAYELAMGGEAVSTDDGTLKLLAPAKDGDEQGEAVVIQPGQLTMLLTEEVVAIKPGCIGFISIKAGIKLSGLVNVSGFHVDPGFVGKLKFTVYNAGSQPISIRRGQPTFLLWFADLDTDTIDVYDGKRKGQRHIDANNIRDFQGTLASPASLDIRIKELTSKLETEIERLRSDLKLYKDIAVRVGVALAMLAIGAISKSVFDRVSQSSARSEPSTAGVSVEPPPSAEESSQDSVAGSATR